MHRNSAAAAATMALLGLAASAALASPLHYFPKPGQSCMAGYARKLVKVRERRRGKTIYRRRRECVLKPTPGRTATITDVGGTPLETQYNADGTKTDYFPISGTVYDSSTRKEVRGLPMTYTITDYTTHQVIGTFAESSNIAATCTIVVTHKYGETMQTFTGQAVTPYPACSLGSVSMPAADDPLLTASFAGNSQYAPSTSEARGL